MAEDITSKKIRTTDVSMTFKVTASKECEEWFYKIDGSSWISANKQVGYDSEITISNLSPDTKYKIQFRAKRKGWPINLESHEIEAYTTDSLKIYIDQPNDKVYLDSPNAEIISRIIIPTYIDTLDDEGNNVELLFQSFQATGGYTIILRKITKIEDGQTSILLSREDCENLLNVMPSLKSCSFTMRYIFKKDGIQYGEEIMVTDYKDDFYGSTTAENSSPIFENFTFHDANDKTYALTQDREKLIQGQSELTVEYESATPQNGATISAYTVTVGGTSKSVYNTTSVSMGKINFTGTVPIVVTAIDSRGYSTTLTKLVNFIPYQPIQLNSLEVSRINDIEETTRLSFSGSITPVIIDGTDKNPFKLLTYQFKTTNTTDYEDEVIMDEKLISWNGNNFSADIPEWIDFTEDMSFDIRITVRDQLTRDREAVTIPNGRPLLSLRKRMVGINNNAPEYALDIDGDLNLTGNVYINGTQRL